jgi:hypothetical protein
MFIDVLEKLAYLVTLKMEMLHSFKMSVNNSWMGCYHHYLNTISHLQIAFADMKFTPYSKCFLVIEF